MDYKIVGNGFESLEVTLFKDEKVIAEPGAMIYFEDGIISDTKAGDGSHKNKGVMGTIAGIGKRMLMGESIFISHFSNPEYHPRKVAFAAPFPGNILPIELKKEGGKVLCQKGAFLCADHGTHIDVALNEKIGSGLFGTEGFILQRLEGDGNAFIQTGGGVHRIDLVEQTIKVDVACTLGFTEGLKYSIGKAGTIKSMLFGKEGIFVVKLSGTGTVWVQNMPFPRLAATIEQVRPKDKEANKDSRKK